MKSKIALSFLCFIVCSYISLCTGITSSTYITATDTARLKKVFLSAIPPTDIASAHYAILGLSLLGEKVPDTMITCQFLNNKVEKQLESIYHASSASKDLGNCKLAMAGLQQYLESAFNAESSVQDLYYSVSSMKNLNFNVDSSKVSKLLASALKKDDSVLNLGYAFHVASKLQGDLTQFFERIEDVVVQADEVDGKYLQFEGGLGITSTTINGVYNLAEVVKKAPGLSPEEAVKFTNYFLSRKFVQSVKGAAQLLDILKILSTNKFHIPVALMLASSSAVSAQGPTIQIRITNVLGKPLGPLIVTADSATRIGDNVAVLTKKNFQVVKGSDTLYSLNFMESKPLRGFYNLVVSALPTKSDPRLVGNTAAQISVKVMTEVDIENIEVSVGDRDQSTSSKSVRASFPQALLKKLEADFHQKIFMTFALKDKNAKTVMSAHQAFVQFVNLENGQEVIFVAETDLSNTYKFDLDVNSKAKDFSFASSDYDINLIVGDAVIQNPFVWKMGQIHLTFPASPSLEDVAESAYAPKPEIKHLFREQERRPSTFVSNAFSILVLMPLFLLFSLWFKLGANVYNFPLSLSAVGFHVGLASIFLLFICFWVHLNMFSTLKYMSALCLITFLSGHSLLCRIACSREV